MNELTIVPIPKPGWKTTEFWLSVAASILGLLFASGIIPTDSAIDKMLGMAVIALSTLGYTVSRGIVKKLPPQIATAGLIFGLLAGGLLSGCTTTQNRITYQTLYGIGKATDNSYQAYNDLVVAGQIPAASLEKVCKVWDKYRASYNTAVDAAKLNLNAPAPQDVIDLSTSVIATINAFK